MLRKLFFVSACAALFAAGSTAGAQEPPSALFATVDGTEISAVDYDRNAQETFRRKFYHGKPPEAEVSKMLHDVGQALIDQVLLDAAARAGNLVPDPAVVAAELDKVDARNQDNPQWKERRGDVLPVIKAQVERRARIDLLEKQVRQVNPTSAEVREFYQANLPLFTEPARNKASLILIQVDPSSPPEAWEQAQTKILEIKAQIAQGADFATLAKETSNDPTAAAGGDLGYLHDGMLSGQAEEALAGAKIGEISEPVRTLEGYALLRLDDRKPSQLQPFDAVESRASGLLVEKKSAAQWDDYLKKLRAQAKIAIAPEFQKVMSYSLPPRPEPDPVR